MLVKTYVLRALKEALSEEDCDALVADFKLYKNTGKLPSSFGRDVPYHLPKEALEEDLYHLHINDSHPWPIHYLQYNRTSDTHLVYCQGFKDPNKYALIALLSPDAHDQAQNIDFMKLLAGQAGRFREVH